LSEFKAAWNDRPLGAEHNWTPQQISVNGMIHPDNSSQTAVSHILHNRTEDLELYRIDPDGPVHPEEDESSNTVEVPQINPSGGNHGQLLQDVDPMSPSDDFGVDLYLQVINILGNAVLS
jgi:hypothetical protein